MASKQRFYFDETVDTDTDTIYENVDDLKTTTKPSDDVGSDFRHRRRQNSRGSSSAEDSSGSFSVTDAVKPPKTPAKLRIPKPESNRDSAGSVKNSYDDVTINFGKPVIGQQAVTKSGAVGNDDDDIFGSVSFQSPIQELTTEEKEILFSLALQRPPIPAPRPSKLSPKLGDASDRVTPRPHDETEIPPELADSEIYEDPEDLKSSSVGPTPSTNRPAPQVPPRNSSVEETSLKSSTLKTIHSYENVYCELQPQPPKSVENIIDRRLDPPSDAVNDRHDGDDEDDFPAKFGARPRSKK